MKFVPQEKNNATYAKKIEKAEAKINWNNEAKMIIAKINALYPNPGTWMAMDRKRIKILKAVAVKKKGKPGEIIDKNFTIGCSDAAIQILELKQEGKKRMKCSDFLIGHNLQTGKVLDGV